MLLVIVESISAGVTDRRVHFMEFRSFNPLFEMDKVEIVSGTQRDKPSVGYFYLAYGIEGS